MENGNGFAVGDRVVWEFVFDQPEYCGMVVEVVGDRMVVECSDGRATIHMDDAMLESEYDAQFSY